jgi:hypothetical protein
VKLPIANCRLPILKRKQQRQIGNWQSAIGNKKEETTDVS